jgi:peptidoglycan L-alanyl-D-glutamate endopeptidase CwlK
MRNEEKLLGVNEDLVKVIKLAASRVPFEVVVLEGVRTKERQMQLYAQGRTAPGPKVTWTMHSTHFSGRAVDIAPYPINWNDVDRFITLGLEVYHASDELSIPIRWGYDWDGDRNLREKGESDGPHYELI